MNLNKAENISNKFKRRVSQFTNSTVPQTRNLRVTDRQLQTWCSYYCPKYGCSWCKTNDIFFGVDCSNFCRRREEEEEEQEEEEHPNDRELQTDGLASFISDRNKFTAAQDATCAAMLAAMVRDKWKLTLNVEHACMCYVLICTQRWLLTHKDFFSFLCDIQELAASETASSLATIECFLVPQNFVIPS
jgi:hypothetical protein